MDPQLANLDLDPPRQPSPMRRGLLPALLVNAVFFAGVALSLHWQGANPGGDTGTRADAGSETRTMGAAPATPPPPASPNEPAPQVTQPQPQPQSQSQPQPQLQTPGPPQPQPQPQRQPVTQAVPPAAPPMRTTAQPRPEPRVQPPARSESRPRRQAAQDDESGTRQATGVAVQPSFDCAKASSRSERIICSDPELAQLDRDTGRLHARAKAAARDPAAFKRQNDREWKQREANCRDKACLLAWYAHRREQLQQAVAQAR